MRDALTAALVLPWSHIVYGSIIGPAVAVAALWLVGERQARTLAIVALAACAGTWSWNTMLNVRQAVVVDGDIPFRPFPISWQDTGTAVFAFAAITGTLLASINRNQLGQRTLKVAGIATAAVFVMDVYAW